jgi:hypothetical protein
MATPLVAMSSTTGGVPAGVGTAIDSGLVPSAAVRPPNGTTSDSAWVSATPTVPAAAARRV